MAQQLADVQSKFDSMVNLKLVSVIPGMQKLSAFVLAHYHTWVLNINLHQARKSRVCKPIPRDDITNRMSMYIL